MVLSRIKKWFKKQNWGVSIFVILMIVAIIAALVTISFYIWAFETYKDTPLAEIPEWVIWILH